MLGLEIYSHTEPGFKPLINFGSWRVACSNGPTVYQHKEITSLSRHLETDEVFVLLKGSCLLLTAANGDTPGDVIQTWMEIGQMYNVIKATWHGSIQLPGAKVMIVENRDTNSGNSQSCDIKEMISL